MKGKFELVGGKRGEAVGTYPTMSAAVDAMNAAEKGHYRIEFSAGGERLSLGRFNFNEESLYNLVVVGKE